MGYARLDRQKNVELREHLYASNIVNATENVKETC
jgi:hypothetical protein